MPGNKDFSYEIKEEIAVLSTNEKSGWQVELNYVAWGEYNPKYDIRPWAPNHEKMGKGVTLTKAELKALRDTLNGMDLDKE